MKRTDEQIDFDDVVLAKRFMERCKGVALTTYGVPFGFVERQFNEGRGSLKWVGFDSGRRVVAVNTILGSCRLAYDMAKELGWNLVEFEYGYPAWYRSFWEVFDEQKIKNNKHHPKCPTKEVSE